ncbi:class I SAM-dependent methyltransferase [Pyrinomonas methylaliphatogenes]|uniref:Methylase involved in ubiquinone/menaquinone biosynthesis n=1 Tax=Pyrinomonas methylaliphatogenes TaxID=454194 RepID=A0A0B6WWP5_9BACT|nr:methyltransferase domain-containing protein [Pyrinomonas methylaliphatogenes]CDM64704.1 methylase involved in ubiquinone/menaquinone biosynthesis [Pyrinomonas methylaliphatogenes]
MNTTRPLEHADGVQRLSSQSFAELYEQILVGPLFHPWVDALLQDIDLGPGDRVLDIACGTGIVARIAKERLGSTGTVVGVDVNPQMLAVARSLAPAIDWREGDAGALPLRDGEAFDVVMCQQGFQFFPDRATAAREMHRALVKGGRFGVSTWRPDEEFPVLRELRAIAERHIGPIADRRHSLGDPASLKAILRETGFHDIRSKRFSRTIRFQDGSVFVRLNAMALVGMSTQASTLDDEGRQRTVDAIVNDSAELVRSQSDGAGFHYEIGTNVVLARA